MGIHLLHILLALDDIILCCNYSLCPRVQEFNIVPFLCFVEEDRHIEYLFGHAYVYIHARKCA